jgi:putative transposase
MAWSFVAGTICFLRMDSHNLLMATRHVELNPVCAHLVLSPEKYKWSSAAAHITGQDDGVVKVAQILERVAD